MLGASETVRSGQKPEALLPLPLLPLLVVIHQAQLSCYQAVAADPPPWLTECHLPQSIEHRKHAD